MEKEALNDRINRLYTEGRSACSDFIPPTSLTQTTKALFNEEQVKTLKRLFPDMLQNCPISRKVIQERLSSDGKGKRILETLSLTKVVNRINYERRQIREKQ